MHQRAPERIDTPRLVLRRPVPADAHAIFSRYASDAEVTRYVAWPRHITVADTEAFITFSEAEWARWPGGPYVILDRHSGHMIGSTALGFDTADRAMTGYVLAKDAWGHGYATEALHAIVGIAEQLGVMRLYALCHPDHAASAHVLEKCAFVNEDVWLKYTVFPNLDPHVKCDVACWSRHLGRPAMSTEIRP